MKHIKAYKIFESSDLLKDIEDICLELTDEGFNVLDNNYNVFTNRTIHDIQIWMPFKLIFGSYHYVPFLYTDIEDTVLRLIEVLGDKFKSYKFINDVEYLFYEDTDISKIKLFLQGRANGEITKFEIKWVEQLDIT